MMPPIPRFLESQDLKSGWSFWAGFVLLACAVRGWGQVAAGANVNPQTISKKSCTVNRSSPDAAETALNRGDFKQAEPLLRGELAKDTHNDEVHEALVRDLIELNRVTDAAKEADGWAATEPANAMAWVAVGEARLREGNPREAFTSFQKAGRLDLCNARVYYGLSVVDGMAGLHATAKQMIEQAYALHPSDDEIHAAWIETRPRKERLEKWADYAEHSDQISDENREKLKKNLEKQSLYRPSDCKAAPSSPREATVPMAAVMDGPTRFIGWGLDVQFNGKRRRLQIDTGASGITISRGAAMFLGLQREDTARISGIGDHGPVKSSIAKVASIKIGGVEFTNCPVEIIEKWSALDSDGLIGADVFRESQVTLDFPKHQLRIAPLPDRPGEKQPRPALASEGDEEEDPPQDAYVAPEMAKWQRIWRTGHDLLMPGGIVETKHASERNAWTEVTFLLDTGSESNLISPSAAAKVTKVSHGSWIGVAGISGEVNKVYEAGKFTLTFANLRLDSPSMTAIDLTDISHGSGMEIAGLIGAPALFQIVLHIDYRDNLVWCEYEPPK